MASILKNEGAKAFYLAIFLNAVIDLGHKITIQNTVFKVHDGAHQIILIAVINALILLPYILLVVPIGQIANRSSKPAMMKVAAWFSLGLTVVIAVFYSLAWFWPAFFITLLMAVQSAFYSPAKLSYLKVLFGEERLAESNGLAQATAIAGILLGTLIFSLGFESLYKNLPDVVAFEHAVAVKNAIAIDKNTVTAAMAPLGLGLIALAALQVFFVYRIPQVAEVQGSKQEVAEQGLSKVERGESSVGIFSLLADARIFIPVLCLALFWSVGQGMLAAFPAFAKAHAGIDNAAVIQGILASSAVGIAFGAFIVGRLSVGTINLMLVPAGVAGLSLGLWSLTFLNSPIAFSTAYFTMGIASAMLIVPLNAYIQQRATANTIGGVIASSNFFQNIAMLTMLGLTIAFALADFDSRYLLQMMALLTTILGSILAWLILRFERDDV